MQHTNNDDFFGSYLETKDACAGDKRDEKQLLIATLMNDCNNIRQTQQSYGMPTIGDLFKARPEDIQETVNSLYFMMKQRVADVDFRQEIRAKLSKQESLNRETQDTNAKLRAKLEAQQSQMRDLELTMKNNEYKAR